MGVVLCGVHLEKHILRPNIGVMRNTSWQTLALHFVPVRVDNPIGRGHEHISMRWVESHGCSAIWLTPLISCSRCGSRISLLLLLLVKHRTVLRGRGSFMVRWRHFRVNKIDSRNVMDASSPLILASWKLPDEVLLSMASHLSRCPSGDEIARDVSPVPFSILLQPHKEQSAAGDSTFRSKKKQKTKSSMNNKRTTK